VAGVTIDDVRALTAGLPRSYEVFVRGRVKFRVGQIVYLAFSRDETLMGFAFPKEEREWLVGTEPEKFLMPRPSDLRYNWVVVRLAAIDEDEMRDLVIEAWSMVVPRRLSGPYRALPDPERMLTAWQPIKSQWVWACSSTHEAARRGWRGISHVRFKCSVGP